jgi:hypothetical protein
MTAILHFYSGEETLISVLGINQLWKKKTRNRFVAVR